ncbi:MAG: S46 family peptidase [Candidatus Acidiferrales bacterium]
MRHSRYMKRFLCGLMLGGFFLLVSAALADEGMWLYNAFPKAKVQSKYGFTPSQAWLDHIRLSSIRFNNGTGSFVSPDGLAFTNHHIASDCIHSISTGGKDYMKTGFYAPTRAEEPKCPDLELDVLEKIEDVTARVNAGVTPKMSAADAEQARRAAMAGIEKDCATTTGLRCDVVTFYSGELYDLYSYKKYTDVRLVFAPEFDAAFFGGDPDNFTYPRYDLDISFFHVYENNQPVHTENYLRWSARGVREGDLIFVSGNPGATDRLDTVAQLEFIRDVQYPFVLDALGNSIARLQKFASESPENARIAQEDLFFMQNSYKAFTGEEEGLQDPQLMEKKKAEEQKLRDFVENNPKRKAEFGDPWAEIEQATDVYKRIYYRYALLESSRRLPTPLGVYARELVRLPAEEAKPNGDRLREYRESALPTLEQDLFSTAPVYKSEVTITFAYYLELLKSDLGDDPAVAKVLAGRSPEEAAKEIIGGTQLDDPTFRHKLFDGGEAAIESSTDPLIIFMRDMDPEARAVRKEFDDQVDAVRTSGGTAIAKARFAMGGLDSYPDATFTLRLSYGAVEGYRENETHIPYFTTIGGAFRHAAEHADAPPYQLPQSWMAHKSKLALDTPLNFVSTADIIGGNSGSATVNREGEVVGIIFDGNIQSLPWDFVYSDEQGRAVSVDVRGIIEALRNVYGATALADELTGAAKSK